MNLENDILFIDMGTTAIAFAIIDPKQPENVQIFSPNAKYQGIPLNSKMPTTLHIYTDNDDEIFDQSTIEQRSYLGEDHPDYYHVYMQNHPNGIDYQFHGLKTYVYQQKENVRPINYQNKSFNALQVFKVALNLVHRAANLIRKNNVDNEIRIVFLVPANSSGTLMDYLKIPIVEVFTFLQQYPDNLSEWLTFIKEPLAASQYATNEIVNIRGRQVNTHDEHEYSNIAIIDMGGGTCDFNLIRYFPKVKDAKNRFQPLGRNCACFAGGYYIDQQFLLFLSQMFPSVEEDQKPIEQINVVDKQEDQEENRFTIAKPNLKPQEISQILQEFVKKKKEFVLETGQNCEFSINIPEQIDNDHFNYIDGIFQNCFVTQPNIAIGQFDVPQSVFQVCFDEELQRIKKYIISFFSEAAKNDHFDHIIIVGGLIESPYVQKFMNDNVYKLYQQFGNNQGYQTDVLYITSPSIAIIKGAVVMYQNDHESIIKPASFTAQENVFFQTGNSLIQMYEQGLTYEANDKSNNLANLMASDKDAKQAIATFQVRQMSEDGLKIIQDNTLKYVVNIEPNVKYQLHYDISQGHRLILIAPDGSTKSYDNIAALIPSAKPQIFMLIDVTFSMQKFVQNIAENLKQFLSTVKKNKFNVKFIFYSDFDYKHFPNLDPQDSTKFPYDSNEEQQITECYETGDIEKLKQFLLQQATIIENRKNDTNDLSENLLPAFERVLQVKSNKQQIVIVIGDACAHTHIGCEIETLLSYKSQMIIEPNVSKGTNTANYVITKIMQEMTIYGNIRIRCWSTNIDGNMCANIQQRRKLYSFPYSKYHKSVNHKLISLQLYKRRLTLRRSTTTYMRFQQTPHYQKHTG